MSDPINRLIGELSRLPGIGEKTAARLAFYIIRQPKSFARNLATSLQAVSEKVGFCSVCQNLTAIDPCSYCTDTRRTDESICVVENVQALRAVERTSEFRGRYHILHGLLSPLDGVGPEELRIRELLARLHQASTREVMLALSPTIEGDATVLYLHKLLSPLGVRLTRLATGVSIGADLEHTDPATLTRAIQSRQAV